MPRTHQADDADAKTALPGRSEKIQSIRLFSLTLKHAPRCVKLCLGKGLCIGRGDGERNGSCTRPLPLGSAKAAAPRDFLANDGPAGAGRSSRDGPSLKTEASEAHPAVRPRTWRRGERPNEPCRACPTGHTRLSQVIIIIITNVFRDTH